jgi:hypothetical protein
VANIPVKGYPDVWGKHKTGLWDHAGPTSYPAGGEVLGLSSSYGGVNPFGTSSYDYVQADGLSNSGNYYCMAQYTGTGLRTTCLLRWFFSGLGGQGVDSVIIATAGSGQTNGTYTANASSGTATIQYVIAGGALTSVKVLNPGGPYTTAPTFTIAAGGTPGTVTASIGPTGGLEAAPGANLSGETIRLMVTGK